MTIRDEQPKALGDTQPGHPAFVAPASIALQMCMLAEGGTSDDCRVPHSFEWHSAAAHVVALACGKRVLDCDSSVELTYNKESLENLCITVE